MINIPCGKCESMNIGKNSTAAAGARVSITALTGQREILRHGFSAPTSGG